MVDYMLLNLLMFISFIHIII